MWVFKLGQIDKGFPGGILLFPGNKHQGFPGGSEDKASACNAGDPGSIPGLGRFPWRRKWQSTPVFLPGESHGERSLVGYSPRGREESHPHTHTQRKQNKLGFREFHINLLDLSTNAGPTWPLQRKRSLNRMFKKPQGSMWFQSWGSWAVSASWCWSDLLVCPGLSVSIHQKNSREIYWSSDAKVIRVAVTRRGTPMILYEKEDFKK